MPMNFRVAAPLILAIVLSVSCGERDAVPADHPLWDWDVEETEAPEGSPEEGPSVDEPSQSPPVDDPLRDEETETQTAARTGQDGSAVPGATQRPAPGPGRRLDGEYRLARVEGEALPVTVDRRPGCEIQIVSGTLAVERGEFRFSSVSREICDGRGPDDHTHRAVGRVAREEASEFALESTDGEAFGTAHGTRSDDRLVIHRVAHEGGAVDVQWEFRKAKGER
jgi:hypothetical protein